VTKAEGDYFHNFETELLPKITWEEMVKEGKIISPRLLIKILRQAKEFLITTPGPNLEKRKVLVPEWLDYWTIILKKSRTLSLKNLINPEVVSSDKITAFDQVREKLHLRQQYQAGVLFVAGAEGHAGHLFALEEMSHRSFPVWVFEQDNYFKHKIRPGPFLPLEVRLSMWCCDQRMGLVSVAPECPYAGDLNSHYKKLFDQTGASRCFADILDPNAMKKVMRGEFSITNLLHHRSTASTSDRVERLTAIPEEFRPYDDGLVFGSTVDPLQIEYPNFFNTQDYLLNDNVFET
jgi:hypothetical protein